MFLHVRILLIIPKIDYFITASSSTNYSVKLNPGSITTNKPRLIYNFISITVSTTNYTTNSLYTTLIYHTNISKHTRISQPGEREKTSSSSRVSCMTHPPRDSINIAAELLSDEFHDIIRKWRSAREFVFVRGTRGCRYTRFSRRWREMRKCLS